MSSAIASATRSTVGPELDRTVRRRVARVRPVGRSGRRPAPRSRPLRQLAPPSLAPEVQRRAHACTGEAAAPVVVSVPQPARSRTRTRLTDRGIAVILVAGAMIVLAAVTVVTLTALQVTGDGAQPLPASYAAQP